MTNRLKFKGPNLILLGGHSQSGYWVDVNRKTTLEGLYAAGDVVGGAPKKYVTACMVEGKIAGLNALEYIKETEINQPPSSLVKKELKQVYSPLYRTAGFKPQELEARLQKIMDEYAGGISTDYQLSEKKLLTAQKLLSQLEQDLDRGTADNKHQLLKLQEVVDRLEVAKVLVKHLLYRQETRWPGYQERANYPESNDDRWLVFVNSIYDRQADKIQIRERSPVR